MYALHKPVPDEVRAALAAYRPLTQTLLYNRGITTAAAAAEFLSPNYDTGRHDPFLLPDMGRAVERILRALRDGEHVTIYSDYDCDGIPGGALLHDFFSLIPGAQFSNYIPHRHEEGYGLNERAIDTIAEKGTTLIITVDCGITDIAPVLRAGERGVDVIVTDHHEPGETLPPAYAVVNPKRADSTYPFGELCGTGVAWKLVEALIASGAAPELGGKEKWLLDVVGIATIADMVPLSGENRLLARYGLTVLQKTRRPGLRELLRGMRLEPRHLTEDDIGFMIAPRINAASRMDNPEDAFFMLTETDESAAGSYARHLEKINNERRGVVAAMVKDIKKKMAHLEELRDVLVIGNPLWRPSLVGLAANSLVEEYRRPVFIWGKDGRDVIKGSCRSNGTMSVVALMERMGDALIEYGGHHLSGGFSVRQEHIHTFDTRVNDAFHTLVRDGRASVDEANEFTFVDADLTLSEVREATCQDIYPLAPFGIGNPKPLFRFRAVVPEKVIVFGKTKEHIKALFGTDRGTVEAIAFFAKGTRIEEVLSTGMAINLIAHIERSYFGGRSGVRMRIVDALPAS